MPNILVESIRPSQIDVSKRFFDTVWQNIEKEMVARNIVIISQWDNDQWTPFSFEDYCQKCEHTVSTSEHAVIMQLEKEGYLQCKEGKYHVQNKFIGALGEYVI